MIKVTLTLNLNVDIHSDDLEDIVYDEITNLMRTDLLSACEVKEEEDWEWSNSAMSLMKKP
jgi:hypothetical protein